MEQKGLENGGRREYQTENEFPQKTEFIPIC